MGDLARDMRTLFEAVDPLRLHEAGREKEYGKAINELELRLHGHETPEQVNELLEGIFQDVYGEAHVDASYLAQEISELMGSLGV